MAFLERRFIFYRGFLAEELGTGRARLLVLLHWATLDFSQSVLVRSRVELGDGGEPSPCRARVGVGIWMSERMIYCGVSFNNGWRIEQKFCFLLGRI